MFLSLLCLFCGQSLISDDFPVAICYWQHDGLDEDGRPEQLGLVEYAITHNKRDPNDEEEYIVRRMAIDWRTDWQRILADHGVPKLTVDKLLAHYRADVVTELVEPAPYAGEYLLWVRVCDLSSNCSDWSSATRPIEVLDVTPPSPPQAVGYYGIGHGW